MTDPNTLCYNALWELLESWKPLAKCVKIGNRVKFDSKKSPIKEQVGNSDFPEIRVVPDGMSPVLQISSSSASYALRFAVQLATGVKQLTGKLGADVELFPLEFMIFRAMSNWYGVLSLLEWQGVKFAKFMKAPTVEQGSSERDVIRGIDGWASVWSCEFSLVFPLVLLQNANLD